jgi:hypothetical protein
MGALRLRFEVATPETDNVVGFSERSLVAGKTAIKSFFWRASST